MFIDKFVGLIPKNNLKKALAYFNKGDYQKACKEFEGYLTKRREEQNGQEQEMVRMYMVEAYISYAKELKASSRYIEAAEQLEKAIEIEPGYADVHYNLACLYEILGKTDVSKEQLRTALDINSNFFRARVMLAGIYHRNDQRDKAIEELSEFLSAAPTFYTEQVRELIQLIRTDSDPEKREEIFRWILEEKPSSSQVSKQISLEAIQNGDYDFALAELKKAISLNPDYPDLHNLIGIAYANKGMTDDAIMEFETALKIHPNYLKAHLNVALTLHEKGAREEAMKHLDKVLELDPENELARNLFNELQPITIKR
jgi:protein O-GlcNAc transferase